MEENPSIIEFWLASTTGTLARNYLFSLISQQTPTHIPYHSKTDQPTVSYISHVVSCFWTSAQALLCTWGVSPYLPPGKCPVISQD